MLIRPFVLLLVQLFVGRRRLSQEGNIGHLKAELVRMCSPLVFGSMIVFVGVILDALLSGLPLVPSIVHRGNIK
jgi:hypothetical protein